MSEAAVTAPSSRDAQASEDFCPILGVDHIEFYVGNAKQATHFYQHAFGFRPIAYRGLETGERETCSYVLAQGGIRLVITSAYSSEHSVSRHVSRHGDGVGVIGLAVPDAEAAFAETPARGAVPMWEPIREEGPNLVRRISGIRAYGDTAIRFVERPQDNPLFSVGFEELPRTPAEPSIPTSWRWLCFHRYPLF